MGLMPVLIIFSCLPLLIVFFCKWRYTYWTRKGIVQLNPEFFYGDLRQMLTSQISIGEAFRNVYFAFKNQNLRFGGVYLAFKPIFIPVNRELIRDMTVKSFSHFQDRGFYANEKDILTNNLVRMSGYKWKTLRVKLTPTFTSSKMRMMFEALYEKTGSLETVAEGCIKEGGKMNVTDISGRFTTDVIGVYGKKANIPNPFKQWLENTFPGNFLWFMGYKCFPELEDFFRNLVAKTIENAVFRKDFIHLLLQLRNRGVLSDDGNISKDGKNGILTDDEVVAQCFLFFVAGFDTSSAAIAFILYELAQNQDIQDKVREEMRKVFSKYGGKLTYEGVKELVYTEMVILETLRKYPLLPSIPRICTKAYKIPGTDIVLEKGTSVQIPAWGIHMDPEYYPNPEKFDPERFSEEGKVKRPDFGYLAFGEGPRVCIGARFAMVQIKVGLCGLLRGNKYTFLPETPRELSYKPTVVVLQSEKEICLHIQKV